LQDAVREDVDRPGKPVDGLRDLSLRCRRIEATSMFRNDRRDMDFSGARSSPPAWANRAALGATFLLAIAADHRTARRSRG